MSPTEFMAPDLVRFAFVFGMILSVLLYEKSHLTTGSIVVPGFLGIHIFEPIFVLASLFNAYACYVVVHRIAPNYFLMSSKTKFHSVVVVSISIQLFWDLTIGLQTPLAFAGKALAGFGYVIPGLIAHDMARNGAGKTALNASFASAIVGIVVYLLLIVSPATSLNFGGTQKQPHNFGLVMILALSTVGAIFLNTKSPFRSGGYVTAAYLLFMQISPHQLLVVAAVSLGTYFISCRFLIPTMIIFGRRKFATMLITGSMLMWATNLLLNAFGLESSMMKVPAYAGILILLPGLIANDMQRTSIANVGVGLGLLVSWIFIITNLLQEGLGRSRPEYMMPMVAGLLAIFLFFSFLNKPLPGSSTSPLLAEQGAPS